MYCRDVDEGRALTKQEQRPLLIAGLIFYFGWLLGFLWTPLFVAMPIIGLLLALRALRRS